MQNELGDIREKFGHIDTCPIKAVELSVIDRQLVRNELERILEVLPEHIQPEKPRKLKKIHEKLGVISTRFTHGLGDISKKTDTSSADNSAIKK